MLRPIHKHRCMQTSSTPPHLFLLPSLTRSQQGGAEIDSAEALESIVEVAGRLERHIDALESRQHRCSLGRWPPHSVTCAHEPAVTGG